MATQQTPTLEERLTAVLRELGEIQRMMAERGPGYRAPLPSADEIADEVLDRLEKTNPRLRLPVSDPVPKAVEGVKAWAAQKVVGTFWSVSKEVMKWSTVGGLGFLVRHLLGLRH